MAEIKKLYRSKKWNENASVVENRRGCLWIVLKLINARKSIVKIVYVSIILKRDRLSIIRRQKFLKFQVKYQ